MRELKIINIIRNFGISFHSLPFHLLLSALKKIIQNKEKKKVKFIPLCRMMVERIKSSQNVKMKVVTMETKLNKRVGEIILVINRKKKFQGFISRIDAVCDCSKGWLLEWRWIFYDFSYFSSSFTRSLICQRVLSKLKLISFISLSFLPFLYFFYIKIEMLFDVKRKREKKIKFNLMKTYTLSSVVVELVLV